MNNRFKKNCIVWMSLTMVAFLSASNSLAGDITLAWDPHPDTHSNLIGYNLYYRAGSSVQANPDDANLIYVPKSDPDFDPDHPSYTITDLEDNTKYYVVISAMVVIDDESNMSNEVKTISSSGTPVSGSGAGDGSSGCFINELKLGPSPAVGDMNPNFCHLE